MKYQWLILILVSTLISACGEISYKRGARPEDLERTKRDCQHRSNEASMQQCLKDNGWVVQDLDTFDMFVTTSTNDNQSGGIKTAEELTPTQRAELAAPTIRASERKLDSSSEVSIKSTPATTKESPAATTAVTQPASKGSEPTQATQSTAPSAGATPATTPAPDPLDLYKINSWWKIGAGLEANERDIKACAMSLGDGHQPDAKQQLFTRAMLMCMKEKGWRALKAAK